MDELERSAFGYDDEHGEHMEVQAQIQDILDELHLQMAGDSVEDVTIAIDRRLAAAGIPEQPHRWVQVMAERISSGRPPVADTAAAVDAVRLAESGPDIGATAGAIDTGIGVEAGLPLETGADPAPVRDERESVEPGAVVEGQATPPPASPR
jgi:hypothetical protein